jgi:hypothetical protein
MTDRSPDHTAEPVVVASYPDLGEAEVSKAHLESEGIEAFIVDDMGGGMLPVEGGAGIKVLVQAADAELARRVLEPVDDSDWTDADPDQPAPSQG